MAGEAAVKAERHVKVPDTFYTPWLKESSYANEG